MLYYRSIWLFIGWLLVLFIWVMSLIPVPEQLNIEINHFDKIEHTLAYFLLMAWFSQLYYSKSVRLFYVVGFILMGVVIEILQGVGEIRMFDPFDMLANSFGVLLAWLFIKGSWSEIFVYIESRFIR